jgi:hypothetical protein
MRGLVLIVTLCACASRSTHAQATGRPNTREGFWVSAGLDLGAAKSNGTLFPGWSGSVRLGGTLSQSVLVGGEVDTWLHTESWTATETITAGSLVVLWYPSGTGALYLKFGLGGMMHYWGVGDSRYTFSAPSALLGLGYEVRVGPRLSLSPYAEALAGSTTQLRDGPDDTSPAEETASSKYFTTFLQVGLGLTWH